MAHQERRCDRLRLMGSGIVQVAAQAGFLGTLRARPATSWSSAASAGSAKTLEGLAARGKLEAKAKDDDPGPHRRHAPRFEDLEGAATSSIEAMTENQALKNETFARARPHLPAARAAAPRNTSSLQRDGDGGGHQRPAGCWGCTSSTRCR